MSLGRGARLAHSSAAGATAGSRFEGKIDEVALYDRASAGGRDSRACSRVPNAVAVDYES